MFLLFWSPSVDVRFNKDKMNLTTAVKEFLSHTGRGRGSGQDQKQDRSNPSKCPDVKFALY